MPFVPAKIELTTGIHSHYDAFRIINGNFSSVYHDLLSLTGGFSGGFDHYKRGLTGGDPSALDSIDGNELEPDERALVIEGSNPARVYIYVVASDSGLTENVPWVIEPDINGGSKRWVLAARIPRLWNVDRPPTPLDDCERGVSTGDSWLYDGDIWTCSSDSSRQSTWVKTLQTGSTRGTACEGDDARLPDPGEKAALGGTSGNPDGSNRYVTDSDPRLSDARAPTLHNHELVEIDCGLITQPYAPIIVGDSVDTPDVFDGGFF